MIKTQDNATKGKKYKVQCVDCANKTNHIVLQSVDVSGSEPIGDPGSSFYGSIEWDDNYQIIQCQGCDAVSFRHRNWFSEYQDINFDGNTVKVYPERDETTLKIKEFYNLPYALRRIYREAIACYNNKSFTLCAAGLRAIVEGLCADQQVLGGHVLQTAKKGTATMVYKKNLEGKIAGLCEKGLLTESSSEILHQHRFLGNEAVHELDKPSSAELVLAIEIIEHTLESLYEIPDKARDLNSQRLKRKVK